MTGGFVNKGTAIFPCSNQCVPIDTFKMTAQVKHHLPALDVKKIVIQEDIT